MSEATGKVGEEFWRIKIEPASDPQSPRDDDCSQIGSRMFCAHKRYRLGDEMHSTPTAVAQAIMMAFCPKKAAERHRNKSLEKIMELVDKHCFKLPLYLYDHSGITMATVPFSDPWDSGQVGFIACSREEAKSALGDRPDLEQAAYEQMRNEVATYDTYLRGDIWDLEVIGPANSEGELEQANSEYSCGFYGSNPSKNSMQDYVPERLHALLQEAA